MADDRLILAFQEALNQIMGGLNNISDITDPRQRQQAITLLTEILAMLGQDINDVLPQELANEYANGSALALSQLSGQLANLNGGFNQKVHAEAVQELIHDTGGSLLASIRTAEHMGITAINQITDEVTSQIGQGLITGNPRKVSTREIKQYFAENGLTSFITRDNKRLPLDFYAKTVVRTKRKEANVKGQINRYTENGVEYIRVEHHSPSCGVCSRYHGTVIQIGGEPTGNVAHISNTQLPPYHPNCRCTIVPVYSLEGESKLFPSGDDPRSVAERKSYKAEQDIRRRANDEKKLYEKLKAEGIAVPETLGGFRRSRRRNDETWQRAQREYKAVQSTAVNRSAVKNTRDPRRVMADRQLIDDWRMNRGKAQNPNTGKWTPEGTPLYKQWEKSLTDGDALKPLLKYKSASQWDEYLKTIPPDKRDYMDGLKQKYKWGRVDPDGLKGLFGDDADTLTVQGLVNTFNPDPSRFEMKVKKMTVSSGDMSEMKFNSYFIDKKTGEQAGQISRTIVKRGGKVYVKHDLLEFEEEYQGGNMATELYFKTESMYKRIANGGEVRISTTANITVGAYAWSRHGFDFKDPEALLSAQTSIRRKLQEDFEIKKKQGLNEPNAQYIEYEKAQLNKMGYKKISDIKHSWQIASLDNGERYDVSPLGYDLKGEGHFGKYIMLGEGSWEGLKVLNGGGDSELIGHLYYQTKGIAPDVFESSRGG